MAAICLQSISAFADPGLNLSLAQGAASNHLVGEEFCIQADLSNNGDTGYGPYYQLILNADLSFSSANFLNLGAGATVIGDFEPPNNQLVDSFSGQTVSGPEGGSLMLLEYPVSSLVAGQPALAMSICMTLNSDALIDVTQADAFKLVPAYKFGDAATGVPGVDSFVGSASEHAVTPKLVTYDDNSSEAEGETPPGPDFPYNWQLTANIAHDLSTALDFPLIELPANTQFVGPVSFNGVSCNVVTVPADLTLAPGGSLKIDCPSETGIAGNDIDAVISFPVYNTDTLAANQCAADSNGTNTSKHMTIIKRSSGDNIPGGTVTYTLDYEVSQYLSAGISAAMITDIIPDGLTYNNDGQLVHSSSSVALTASIGENNPGLGETTVSYNLVAAAGVLAPSSTGQITYSATIDQTYSVDGGDVLARDMMTNTVELVYDTTAGANSCSDQSSETISIADVNVSKTLLTSGVIKPGDEVIFRLTMDIPSGDSHNVRFDDFLPLPVFDATSVVAADVSLVSGIDTLGKVPTLSTSGAENSLSLDFGDISEDSARIISVDIKVQVTDQPFGDGLSLTNILRAFSNNSPVDSQADLTAVGLIVRAPMLTIEKTITSDVSSVEAGDQVDFKVVISNTGGAPAYDVDVHDVIPAQLTACIVDSQPAGSGDFFDIDSPYRLASPIADEASQQLIFHCSIAEVAEIGGTITNTAFVSWASVAGSSDRFPEVEDSISFNLVSPTLTKVIKLSSESATTVLNQLTPGEVVRLRGELTLPQGTASSASLKDHVPTGFAYIDDGTATIAFVRDNTISSSLGAALCSGGTLNHVGPVGSVTPDCVITASGSPFDEAANALFSLGTLTNTDNDSNAESIVIEYNVMTLDTLANNTATNNYQLTYNAAGHGAINASVNLLTIKPEMSLTKTTNLGEAGKADAGDTVTYTISVANASTALMAANNVLLSDVVPAKMSYVATTLVVDPSCPNSPTSNDSAPAGAGLTVSLAQLAIGQSCQFSFGAIVSAAVTPSESITNTATATWNNIAEGTGTNPNPTGSAPGTGLSASANDSVSFTANNLESQKSIVSSSDINTPEGSDDTSADPRLLAVGEHVRFRLTINIPEITLPGDTVVSDLLPPGLVYQPGTAMLAFVSDAGELSSSNAAICSGGSLATSDENVSPDCALTVAGAPFLDGEDLVFNLSNLTNSSNDANSEFVIIEYDARASNQSTGQSGLQMSNSFTVQVNGSLQSTSGHVVAELVEPQLALGVSVSPNPVDNRQNLEAAVNWAVSLTNTGNATAYQIGEGADVWSFSLPEGLQNIQSLSMTSTGSVTRNGTTTALQVGDFSISGDNNEILTLATPIQLAAGASLLIAFDAQLLATIVPSQNLSRDISVTYRSQPSGDNSGGVRDDSSQATGTGNTPLTSTAALNDYRSSATLSVATMPEAPALGVAKRLSIGPTNLGDGSYSATYQLLIANTGDVPMTNVQLVDDLASVFPSGIWVVNAVRSTDFIVNASFDGNADQQLLNNSVESNDLAVAASGTVEIDLIVTPGVALGPFNNSATGSGFSARTGLQVNDISHNGANHDPGNDGSADDQDPTPISFGETPMIGSAKSVHSVSSNGDGSYAVVFRYVLQNNGDIILHNSQLNDSLADMLSGSEGFTVTAISSADINVNSSFDGAADTALLLAGQSLVVGQQAVIDVSVEVTPGSNLGIYQNNAMAAAESPSNPAPGTANILDTSTDGVDADPDTAGSSAAENSDPNDNHQPTLLQFTESAILGSAKSVHSVSSNGDGSYAVVFRYVLQNNGDMILHNNQLNDNLADMLSGSEGFAVTAINSADINVNSGFDGTVDTALLLAGQSLVVGQQAVIDVSVRVTPGSNLGIYQNNAMAAAESPSNPAPGTANTLDTSTDGIDTDPDTEGSSAADNPDPNDNSQPTKLEFSESAIIGSAKSVHLVSNNGDGSYAVVFRYVLQNNGDVILHNSQFNDSLAEMLHGSEGFTVTAINSDNIDVNSDFDGTVDTALLLAGQSLVAGQQAVIDVSVLVTPGSNLGIYQNNAMAAAESPSNPAPGTANTLDTSTDGIDTDPDTEGSSAAENSDPNDNSQPTPLEFTENPVLGLAKALTESVYNGDRSFDISYRLVLQNNGDVQITELSLVDDLATVFASAEGFHIKSLSSDSLAVNNGYDGDQNKQLLAPGQLLAVGSEALLNLGVTIFPGSQLGPYNNTAQLSGESPASNGQSNVSDVSADGDDPDPDTSGLSPQDNPQPGDNSEPTPLEFELAAIAGDVYGDDDLSASKDQGEGFGGVTLELVDAGPDDLFGTDDDRVIATTTSAEDGSYQFSQVYPAELAVIVAAPEPGRYNSAMRQVSAQINIIARADFPYIDPAGVVYDAITKELIEGAVVNIYQDINANGIYDSGDMLAYTHTTGADGAYSWPMAGPVNYVMTVLPPSDNYSFPSTFITPTIAPDPLSDNLNDLDGLNNGIYYLNYQFLLSSGHLINNDIPLDSPTEGSIVLNKEAHKRQVSKGDLVPYTITAENVLTGSLAQVRIEDTTPPGFKVVEGSARLIRAGDDGQLDTADDVITAIGMSLSRPAVFEPLTLAANEIIKLRYLLTVGAGVGTGSFENQASPYIHEYLAGNTAIARVEVIDDPLFDKTTIIGKVFHDRDEDGWQDPADAKALKLTLAAAANTEVELSFNEGEWQSASIDAEGQLALADLPGRTTTRKEASSVSIRFSSSQVLDGIKLSSEEGSVWILRGYQWQSEHRGKVADGLNGQRLIIQHRWQDDGRAQTITVTNQGVNEEGIPGVRLASVEGLLIETDVFGRYHLADVDTGRFERGRNFILKVDAATLAAGAYFTTENPRVVRLTPSLLTKFNFGVQLPDLDTEALTLQPLVEGCDCVADELSASREKLSESKSWRMHSRAGGVIWGTQDPTLPEPRLSVAGPSYGIIEGGQLTEALAFKTYSNYHAFIERWQIVLYRDLDGLEPLATLVTGEALDNKRLLTWQVESLKRRLHSGQPLYYRLEVFDAEGRIDETRMKSLRLVAKAELSSLTRPRSKQTIGEQDDALEPALPAENYGKNELARRTILLHGSRVRIKGSHLGATEGVRINGETVPLSSQGKFAYEQIMPLGEHELVIEIDSSALDEDETGQDSEPEVTTYAKQSALNGDIETADDVKAPSISSDTSAVINDIAAANISSVIIEPEALNTEVHRRQINVTGEHFFMVAIADLSAAEVNIDGSVEALNDEDHYDNGTVVDGRFGFYLKGKIKGKYLLTAQLDTDELALDELLSGIDEKDPARMFRNLDPDKYYPVYGDDSRVTDDTDSQGKFYVRLDWDRSTALWGNFNTEITGNELAQYDRSLYGAKLDYHSSEVNSYGDSSVSGKLIVSEPQTLFGHNEFFATGGSLYYLRHGEVVQGSAKLWVEIRDSVSGRVLDDRPLEQGRDYDIDELQGRILLSRPLLQGSGLDASSIVRDAAIDGNEVVLIADYEYLPDSLIASGDFGGASNAKWWLNDRIGLGATYVKESRGEQDYSLSGIDATYRWARGSYLKLEAAQSEATQAATGMYSTDGGLSFVNLNRGATENREGDAYSIQLRSNLAEYTEIDLTATAWWKHRDAGFSSARQDGGVEREDYGTELVWQASERLALAMRAAVVKRETVSEDQIISVQAEYELNEKLIVTTELRDEQLRKEGLATEDARLAALKLELALSEQLDIYLIAQSDINSSSNYKANDRYTAGLKQRLANGNLFIEASDGDRGEAYQLGGDYRLNNDVDLYSSYLVSPDGGRRIDDMAGNTFTLGGKSRLSDQLLVFSEYQFSNGKQQSGLSEIYGLDYTTKIGWAFGTALQSGELQDEQGHDVNRDAVSVSARYEGGAKRFSSRLEYRDDDGEVDQNQWLFTSSYDQRLNDSWSFLTKINGSLSEDRINDTPLAKFVEASVGMAYRPMVNDRWNLLAMYTFLYDIPSPDQVTERLPEKADVWSVEALYELDQRWGLGAKTAFKKSQMQIIRGEGAWYDSETYLYAARVRYHIIKEWDALVEYRWLDAKTAEDRRAGALLALYRHLGANAKIGLGYNFADFDDDLTHQDYDSEGWFVNMVGKY